MVMQHLHAHAQIGREGLLFYGVKDGRQLSHGSLLHHFQKAATAAGRPDLTPHALWQPARCWLLSRAPRWPS
jgi:hypothetical protein